MNEKELAKEIALMVEKGKKHNSDGYLIDPSRHKKIDFVTLQKELALLNLMMENADLPGSMKNHYVVN